MRCAPGSSRGTARKAPTDAMATRRTTPQLDALLDEIAGVNADPTRPNAEDVLRRAIRHKHWMPVERAAKVVMTHALQGHVEDLLTVWARFVDPGSKLDPGCRAKEAALTALDTLEWFDPDPFLVAIRYIQKEPAYGPPVDTAGGVRQRALSALLRQHHSHALLYAGEHLADPLIEVRAGAADSLGQYGAAASAGLLVERMRIGDEPRVLLACASALLDIELEFGRSLLGEWLRQPDAERREIAAVALGQCRSAEAADTLMAWLDRLEWDGDLDMGLRALALHRSEPARHYLLECVASGSATKAKAAARALEDHLYDPHLRARLEDAIRRQQG